MAHDFDPTTLREYDIRGIVGTTLGMEDAKAIGRSFGTMIRRAGGSKVATGYDGRVSRSEEHTSELQSLMRNSYAVFCLKKKKPARDISEYSIKTVIQYNIVQNNDEQK